MIRPMQIIIEFSEEFIYHWQNQHNKMVIADIWYYVERPHNSISRKRKTNKMKREAGLEYVGFSVQNNKIKQDTIRMARKMGPSCTSLYCMKSIFRHCDQFNQDTRSIIFQSFWQELKSWDAREIFVQNLVKKKPIENSRVRDSSRKQSFKFRLYLNGDKVQVIFAEDNSGNFY